jgi:Zn finger protein HypA/HybF involved in hydrogenase expression
MGYNSDIKMDCYCNTCGDKLRSNTESYICDSCLKNEVKELKQKLGDEDAVHSEAT